MTPETPSIEAQGPQPTIIPRPDHAVSRRNIDSDALKVLYRLHRHGFLAYLVGGSVRDLQLGRVPKDFDISTDARPSQVQRLFRNSRVIGRRFRLVQVYFRGSKIIEVSTFRRASDPQGDQVLQANNTFGTPAEDALRRDLTINALFYNIADYSVVDYVGGMNDLKKGLIRGVGDPEVRFHRDPVRVLRAVRHAARTGFKLTRETLQAVQNHSHELSLCPLSRIRDEMMRDLGGGSAAVWLQVAHDTGVFYSLLPNLRQAYGQGRGKAWEAVNQLLGRVDQALAARQELPEAVLVSALLWPALVETAAGLELAPGRPGRAQWAGFVRQNLPGLTQPLAFAKRVMERTSQICGILGVMLQESPGGRLPKKVTEKVYFNDACILARLMDFDLKSMASQGPPPARRRGRRRRRPRRRRNRKPPQGGQGQPTG